MTNPGTFDRKVSFCVATTTKTAGGAPQKTFAHSFFSWCSREPVGDGSEQYLNERLASTYKFRFKTYYQSSINETMRIVDNSVNYNILSVLPVDQNMFVEIIAEKVTE